MSACKAGDTSAPPPLVRGVGVPAKSMSDAPETSSGSGRGDRGPPEQASHESVIGGDQQKQMQQPTCPALTHTHTQRESKKYSA